MHSITEAVQDFQVILLCDSLTIRNVFLLKYILFVKKRLNSTLIFLQTWWALFGFKTSSQYQFKKK